VEGTISGAVAWPTGSPSNEGLHVDRSGHREAGPQEMGGGVRLPRLIGVARYQSGVSQEKLDFVEFAAAQTATVD